jgi:hypothetical protein
VELSNRYLEAVKKLLRVVAVVGAVAGVAWAMRERLISIEAPREEHPPRFRVVDGTQSDPV